MIVHQVDEFEKWKEENQRENSDLMQRIKRLEDALVAAKWKVYSVILINFIYDHSVASSTGSA